ncbi:hypothetical protein SK803_10080 [Lentzea sp. BCCO 10_0856]|uniref:DUF2231 domain-containing protein n=1 Tax=Lentzea miocenica TaxID=3095431 RepID=A0ABU4SXB7_9PSEU|nr:DUF2231 domain-containing protein [Lentzea sp. BCCO 10_0856]MDX8030560.1 hypothetical protein [Lentzea sp. BCCO 10_0856]
MPRRLVVLPLALLAIAAGLDLLHLLTGSATLAAASWHLIAAGLLLGIAVAATEWLDRIFAESADRSPGRDLGIAVVLAFFAVSWALRLGQTGWEPTWAAVLAGWAGAAGWLATSMAGRRAQLSSA